MLDDNTLYLDLSPIVDRVKTRLSERGLSRIAAAIPPTVDGRITLVRSSAFGDAQTGVRALKATSILLPILAVLCLIGSVWLALAFVEVILTDGEVQSQLLVVLLWLGIGWYVYTLMPTPMRRAARWGWGAVRKRIRRR